MSRLFEITRSDTKEDFLLMELAFQTAKREFGPCLEGPVFSGIVIRLLEFLFVCDEDANLFAALSRVVTMDGICIFDNVASLSFTCLPALLRL